MKFRDLKLSESILNAIGKMGYNEATPIQELAIPQILEHKDIIGLAQTGTGKTAAFALPIIDMLIKDYEPDRKTKVLILSPTRELAVQIRDNIFEYTKGTAFKCSVILGGVNINSQKEVLKKGIDILVATPGRLVDLINQKRAIMSDVKMLVLDEADTMLDMGFIRDIKSIISKIPENRQTLLFSATMAPEIKGLAKEIMHEPTIIKTKTEEVTADKISQELYYVDSKNKKNLLLEILSKHQSKTTLIFTRTKHGANKLEDSLKEVNIFTSVIHGNKTQANRVKALNDFKNGKTKILIATDIAARGIDINSLGLVINYDIPEKEEIYVHRIGRTARAGKDGMSISFCSSAELKDLQAIERLIGMKIPVIEHNYPMVLTEVKPPQKDRSSQGKKPEMKKSGKSQYQEKKDFKGYWGRKDNKNFSHKNKKNY